MTEKEMLVRLRRWCSNQRAKKKINGLTEEKIDILNEINFIWDYHEWTWENGYSNLLIFKNENGHININKKKYPDLHTWLSLQKINHKKKSLDVSKRNLLISIGVKFHNKNRIDRLFEQGIIMLEDFKKTNTLYPELGLSNFPSPKHQKLKSWAYHKIKLYKSGKLDEDRISILKNIGFDPSIDYDQWEFSYNLYKNNFGKESCTSEIRKKLNQWATNQRAAFKRGELSIPRKEKLEKIGFDFSASVREIKWKADLEKIKDYKQDSVILITKKFIRDEKLLRVLRKLKSKNKSKSICPKKKKILEEIGFDFEKNK